MKIFSRFLHPIFILAVTGLAANPASASEFYSYTGNNYALVSGGSSGGAPPYDTSMRITATLEFASSLPPNLVDADVIPISFLFDDGVNTITENSDIEQQTFRFSTDAFGNITFWNVSVRTAFPSPTSVGDQWWEIVTLNATTGMLFPQSDYASINTCQFVSDSSCDSLNIETGQIDGNPGQWTLGPIPPDLVDLSGTIKTVGGTDICAMVLASGQFTFSCNPVGVFTLTDLPREIDGTVKRQIYADGFFPKIDILTASTNEAVVMTRSGACPDYNTPYDPGFFPDSVGKRIDVSGSVLQQNTQTPICAMVLANGQYMFSCDGLGGYSLDIPLDINGQFKLQVYADGFAPTIQTFDEFQAINDVRMSRAVECQ